MSSTIPAGTHSGRLPRERYVMTERPHAEHRPPVDEDPANLREAPPTKLGQFYPLDDILAVVDDRPIGERAVQALKDAGVPEGDVDLLDGAWFAEVMHSAREHGGIAWRLAHLLPTDESLLVETYVAAAEHGHAIVITHAESPEDVERVRGVLAAHGAREMRHYERHVIRDL
jgi:hypothetical protein